MRCMSDDVVGYLQSARVSLSDAVEAAELAGLSGHLAAELRDEVHGVEALIVNVDLALRDTPHLAPVCPLAGRRRPELP